MIETSEVVISKRDVLAHERLGVISELVPIREKIKLFEEKHGIRFEEFEKKSKARRSPLRHGTTTLSEKPT
ncbi:hypothetical protein [Thermococcus sp.]